jgi:fumarate reductase subunit C
MASDVRGFVETSPRETRGRSGSARSEARRQLFYEIVSGASGAALAFFMWGHMLFVATIWLGASGFDWLAAGLERFYVAQPTVVAITALFLVHAVMASRKIPARLRERRRMREIAEGLRGRGVAVATGSPFAAPHLDSALWIWQVRTGMTILVLGSFHLLLVGFDVLTSLFGERTGIEASSSMARVGGGLWIVYAVLLVCVEFHASAGLYRLAVKWGVGARLSRKTLRRLEHVVLVVFLGLGFFTLFVLAGWIAPPLAFLMEG